jgi:hypothetical protein
VNQAYNRTIESPQDAKTAGFDVARSDDESVLSGKHGDEIQIHYNQQGTNHVSQKEDVRDKLYTLGGPEIAVDAVGEGSGIADELGTEFNVVRFSNGAKPAQESEYYDSWAEALALFGEFLRSGGSIESDELYEQALAAARTVEFSTRSLTSRGGDVIEATSKEKIKDRLGHSPDYLDSALMANWVDMAERKTTQVTYSTGNPTRSGRINQ